MLDVRAAALPSLRSLTFLEDHREVDVSRYHRCVVLGILGLVLAVVGTAGAIPMPPIRIVLLPFEDRAGFRGNWTLSVDVPALLGEYLEEAASIEAVSMDTVQAALEEKAVEAHKGDDLAAVLGKRVGADLAITGVVDDFNMRRFTAGDPNLLGYKSYTAKIKLIDVQLIRVATGEVLGTFEVAKDSTERPLGMDLFGRPRKQDRAFREIYEVAFGSERFYELLIGQTADRAFLDLSGKIVQAILQRPAVDLSGGSAIVLSVNGEEAYLGIGAEDHVESGDRFPIYKGKTRVGLVQVIQIIGPHLCKAQIIEGEEVMEAGLSIGQARGRAVGKPNPLSEQ